jgi:hypothetical protein
VTSGEETDKKVAPQKVSYGEIFFFFFFLINTAAKKILYFSVL